MKKGKITLLTIIYSLCTWLFLCVDMGEIYPNVYKQEGAGIIVNIITELQRIIAGLGDFYLLKEILFALVLYVYFRLLKNTIKLDKAYIACACAMSFLYLAAESYKDTDSLKYITGDPLVFTVSAARFAGLFFILYYAMAGALLFLDSKKTVESPEFGWSFVKVWIAVGLMWLPCLIVMYPGGYGLDVQIYLRQFFGYETLSNAHPPFTTFLTGACVKLGNAMGNPSLGLFVCTFIQFTFLWVTMSYALWFVISRVKNRFFAWISVIWAGTGFSLVYHACNLGKDAQYSACLVLMAVSVYRMAEHINRSEEEKLIIPAVNMAFFSLLGCLLRHNGVAVCAACIVAVALLLGLKKVNKIKTITVTVVCFAGVLLFLVTDRVIYPSLGVERTSGALVYTTELQHTARIMLEYPEEVSDADREVIGKLMDIDRLEERYNPRTSDGIKAIIDLEADPYDVKAYNKVWLKEIKSHPGVLFSASFNITYGFLAPVDENLAMDFGDWYYESEWPELNLKIPSFLTGFRYLYEMLINIVNRLPVIRLLQNPGLYTWLYVFMLVYVIKKRGWELIPSFIPGLVTIAVYPALPSYYGHPRYAFPVMYSMFLYVGLAILFIRTSSEGEESD